MVLQECAHQRGVLAIQSDSVNGVDELAEISSWRLERLYQREVSALLVSEGGRVKNHADSHRIVQYAVEDLLVRTHKAGVAVKDFPHREDACDLIEHWPEILLDMSGGIYAKPVN